MGGACQSKNLQKVQESNLQIQKRKINHQLSFTVPKDQFSKLKLEKPPKTLTNYGLISDFITQNLGNTDQKYHDILQSLKEGGGSMVFQDPFFPSQLSSLTKDINTFERAKKLIWKRPMNFLDSGTTIKVFQDKIRPSDIQQGQLSNFYLLSAVAILAEDPKNITKLFVTHETNQYGCYCIWMNHEGEWQQVIVDDSFPCTEVGGPCFSRVQDNEIWLLLLEKAFAKLFDAYDKIENGLCGHAIYDLTGAPYQYLCREADQMLEPNIVWKFCQDNFKLGYFLIASNEKNTRQITKEEDYLGIESSLSYAILDVREVIASDGNPDKIFKIRNPWGKLEWKGDWSDYKPDKWTKELMRQLDYEKKEEGIFWINLKDFCEEFGQVCVCKISPNYIHSSFRVSKALLQESFTTRMLLMKVPYKTKGSIGVSQKDKRSFAKNQKVNYQYSLFRIIVCKIDPSSKQISQFIGDAIDCDRDIFIEASFEPGDYLIYVDVEWAQDHIRDFVVNAYTSQCVQFTQLQVNEKINDLLIDDVIFFHQLNEDKERVHQYNEDIKRISGSMAGYVYFYYENNSDKYILKEDVKMTEKKYLNICQPLKDVDSFKIDLKPYSYKKIKFRVNPEGRGEYQYQTQINYILLEDIEGEEELKQLALTNPSKVKQREMNGHYMDVFVHTYVYYGGVCFLYVNKTKSKTYIEDLELELENLEGDGFVDVNETIHIEVEPQKDYLLNLKTKNKGEEISYSMKMSYFLR